jgi:hypothetical protein
MIRGALVTSYYFQDGSRAEEETGLIHWLRPEYQAPDRPAPTSTAQQSTLEIETIEESSIPA